MGASAQPSTLPSLTRCATQWATCAAPSTPHSYDEMARQVSVAAASSLPLFSSAPAASNGL